MRYSARRRNAMPMVIVGVLLLLAKFAEFGPFADWSWWIVLAPFGLAVLWWEFADSSGWTKRRAMDKMEKRKVDRRERAMEALGMGRRRDRMATKVSEAKARQVSADPTHAGRDAPSKPTTPADPTRREPRL
jgi:small Trp-rich protein